VKVSEPVKEEQPATEPKQEAKVVDINKDLQIVTDPEPPLVESESPKQ